MIDAMHTGQFLGMNCLESNRRQVLWAREAIELRIGELLQTNSHRDRVIGRRCFHFGALPARFDEAARHRRTDAFHAAARKHLLVRHIEQAVLEAGAAQIGNKDLHDCRSQIADCRLQLGGSSI